MRRSKPGIGEESGAGGSQKQEGSTEREPCQPPHNAQAHGHTPGARPQLSLEVN